MVIREAAGSIGQTNFWGLVQQKGPWKSVSRDTSNAKSSLNNKFFRGGGVQGGGTKNAGNGGWYSLMNPEEQYRIRGPPPKPTRYADRQVTYKSELYAHRQRVGKPRVGAAYPQSGGQFPGSKPRNEQVFQSGASQKVAEEATSQVLAPIDTTIDDVHEVPNIISASSTNASDVSMDEVPLERTNRSNIPTKRPGELLQSQTFKIREPKVEEEIITRGITNLREKDRETSKNILAGRVKRRFNPARQR